jgi:hypothetical protein
MECGSPAPLLRSRVITPGVPVCWGVAGLDQFSDQAGDDGFPDGVTGASMTSRRSSSPLSRMRSPWRSP